MWTNPIDANGANLLRDWVQSQAPNAYPSWVQGSDPCGTAEPCCRMPVLPPASAPIQECTWMGICCDGGNITKLDMSYRPEGVQLQGSVPSAALNMFSSLQYLNMSGHSLNGGLSDLKWNTLAQLDVLDMSRNAFEGGLPNSPNFGESASRINLQDNSFSGTLPYDWGFLQNLRYLNLARNNLAGPMPGSWASMDLNQLDVSGNCGLCGQIQVTSDTQVLRSGTNLGGICTAYQCGGRNFEPLIISFCVVAGITLLFALLLMFRSRISRLSPTLAPFMQSLAPPPMPRLHELTWQQALTRAATQASRRKHVDMLVLEVYTHSGAVCLSRVVNEFKPPLIPQPSRRSRIGPSSGARSNWALPSSLGTSLSGRYPHWAGTQPGGQVALTTTPGPASQQVSGGPDITPEQRRSLGPAHAVVEVVAGGAGHERYVREGEAGPSGAAGRPYGANGATPAGLEEVAGPSSMAGPSGNGNGAEEGGARAGSSCCTPCWGGGQRRERAAGGQAAAPVVQSAPASAAQQAEVLPSSDPGEDKPCCDLDACRESQRVYEELHASYGLPGVDAVVISPNMEVVDLARLERQPVDGVVMEEGVELGEEEGGGQSEGGVQLGEWVDEGGVQLAQQASRAAVQASRAAVQASRPAMHSSRAAVQSAPGPAVGPAAGSPGMGSDDRV